MLLLETVPEKRTIDLEDLLLCVDDRMSSLPVETSIGSSKRQLHHHHHHQIDHRAVGRQHMTVRFSRQGKSGELTGRTVAVLLTVCNYKKRRVRCVSSKFSYIRSGDDIILPPSVGDMVNSYPLSLLVGSSRQWLGSVVI